MIRMGFAGARTQERICFKESERHDLIWRLQVVVVHGPGGEYGEHCDASHLDAPRISKPSVEPSSLANRQIEVLQNRR